MRRAVILGGGPAGLTAALELLERTDLVPIVLERHTQVGGISRTEVHRGNRIDLGGHRFFSKSDRVMDWWLDVLPLEGGRGGDEPLAYQGSRHTLRTNGAGPDASVTDLVMLLRQRRSRILFDGKLFAYPIAPSFDTLRKLGVLRATRIGLSYARSALRPQAEEVNLEQFLVNRFGRELYATFFAEYTEKVWGVPCREIGAEWGAQRIKGLSVRTALAHALRPRRAGDARQKGTETSLIEQFLYPKLGPGQLWEEVARRIEARGGEVRLGVAAEGLCTERAPDGGRRVVAVDARRVADGRRETLAADEVFSTLPLDRLVGGLDVPAPPRVAEIAAGLRFRALITVGVLLSRLALEDAAPDGRVLDNWIYVQEPGVRVGRVQLFHNWSPWLVADPATRWLGAEYFCDRGDDLWTRSDDELRALAVAELERIGLLRPEHVLDGVVLRVPRAYPCYFGSWAGCGELQEWLSGVDNLWPLGRNGQHRYNNQDHSMLTAMVAVDEIVAGSRRKDPVWAVNTEATYHEERTAS